MESILIRVDSDIVLRQFVPSDAPAIFELIDRNREYLTDEGISQKYPTVESVKDSITNPINPKKLRFGIWHLGAFGTSKREVLVGSINVTPRGNCLAEIGYWRGEEYQKKGYISKSAKRLIQFIFEEGFVDWIVANVRKDNRDREKSVRILERLGLRKIAENETQLVFCLER
jgi:ribosomal-protein-serine acetyltransferase